MTHDQNLQDFRKGNELFAQGHFRRAERIADSLIDRKFSGGYELKARCLYEKGQHEEAIAVLEDSVKRYPSVCILWDFLGEYCSNAGRYQDALAAFHQSRNIGGDESFASYNLAITYARMGDFEAAKQFVDHVREPVSAPLRLHAIAWILSGLGDDAEALIAADELVRIDPDNAVGHAHRALALQLLGRAGEARASALHALDLDKSEETALRALCLQNARCDNSTEGYELCVLAKPKQGAEPFPGLRVDGYFRFCSVAAKSPEEALAYYCAIVSADSEYETLEAEVACESVEGHEGVRRIDKKTYSYAMEANPFKRLGLIVQARRYRPPE